VQLGCGVKSLSELDPLDVDVFDLNGLQVVTLM